MNSALQTWNDKLAEIWTLLTQDPATFKGGGIWQVMLGIHGALQAIGYGLLVLFFAVGVVKTCGSFVEVKRPEQAFKLFIRFVLAKAAVGYGLDLMLAILSVDHRQDQPSRLLGFHPALGSDTDRRIIYHSPVLPDDSDSVFPHV